MSSEYTVYQKPVADFGQTDAHIFSTVYGLSYQIEVAIHRGVHPLCSSDPEPVPVGYIWYGIKD